MPDASFLSIVVPFHNSAATCLPLLDVLASLDGSEPVELIFVDDGSTDGTVGVLQEFASHSRAPVQIIARSRGGPGAARNSGVAVAQGKYVWFVDSDDTIDLGAVALAREADCPDLDLIVWDWDHPTIKQRLAPGLHSTSDGPAPADVFDPVVCNWFSRSFLQRTGLRFPEYCFYEATPIEAFILPLVLDQYRKVDFKAYFANVDTPSITRGSGRFAPARYDCLHTIALGMEFVDQAKLDEVARTQFEAAFVHLFLWYVISLSPLPGRSWLRAMRVMRLYRARAKRLRVLVDPLSLYPGSRASRLIVQFLWRLSAALPPQDIYFQRLRRGVWNRDIVWQFPVIPPRWR